MADNSIDVGSGTPAFTRLRAAFTVPAVDAGAVASVGSRSQIAQGQTLFLQGAGSFKAVALGVKEVTLVNLGYDGNAEPGVVIAQGALLTAGGPQGAKGDSVGFIDGGEPDSEFTDGVDGGEI